MSVTEFTEPEIIDTLERGTEN